MRLASFAVIASLSSGCAAVLIPPAIGVAGGTAVGIVHKAVDDDASVAVHTLAGGVLGVVVDVVLVAVLANAPPFEL
jgi:hypothetical protein